MHFFLGGEKGSGGLFLRCLHDGHYPLSGISDLKCACLRGKQKRRVKKINGGEGNGHLCGETVVKVCSLCIALLCFVSFHPTQILRENTRT